jgi:hypothetical protein
MSNFYISADVAPPNDIRPGDNPHVGGAVMIMAVLLRTGEACP